MAGNFIVDFPIVHKQIKRLTNKKLAEVSDFQIDYKAIQLNFLTTEVDLFGLSIYEKKKEIVKASHIKTQISLLSIFLGSPKLSFVDINELNTAVPIVIPEEDTESIIMWLPEVDLPVNQVIVSNSSVVLNIKQAGDKEEFVDLAINDINAELNYNHIDDWNLDATVSRLNLFVKGRHVLKDVNVQTKLNGDSFKAKSEYTYINSKEIAASGDLTLLLAPHKRKKKTGFSFENFKDAPKDKLKSFILKSNLDIKKADAEILGRLLDVTGNKNKFTGKALVNLNVPFAAEKARISVGVKAKSNKAELADFKLLDTTAELYITRDKILFQT